MSEQDDKNTGFRRVSRKDRKRKLETRGPLFPPESDESPPDEAAQFAPPELRAESAPAVEPQAVVIEPPVEKLPVGAAKPPPERFPSLAVESGDRSIPARPAPPPDVKPRSTFLPNLIAILFFVGSIVLTIVFTLIFVNPYTPLNPFPPFTPLPILVSATFLPPTETLPPTPGATMTFTPLPAELIATPVPPAFILVNDGAIYIPNANEQGCNWSSIAGSVTDSNGAPLDGYGVRIQGSSLDETVFTGTVQTYGPGGFELFLNGTPAAGIFTVQLLSPDGTPLSSEYTVTTRPTCQENVAFLSFMQAGTV
jgi:hypothetical protein